ncbi:MAG: magnesium transporter CorA family protein [Rickettsiales bacterium]
MNLYRHIEGKILAAEWQANESIPADVVWIDLLVPTREQELAVEKFLGLEIPTREEMKEIELSNRLYQENGAQFMTATMLSKVDSGAPEIHAVTFIVTQARLVTIRYVETTSFRRFAGLLSKSPCGFDGASLLLGLLDAIVNRTADILERLDREIDGVTKQIFRHPEDKKRAPTLDYQLILEQIGRCGDLASKVHESLMTFSRVASYASHAKQMLVEPNESELVSVRKDIAGLTDHGNYLTGKVQFLLDATLGMISIQQNSVFRILSIASLIFMPPTLVAGIYGMNFKLMPELEWHYGYPLALWIILLSAVLPLALMRQRKII